MNPTVQDKALVGTTTITERPHNVTGDGRSCGFSLLFN
jgi:hypothetical protein